jgi:hypothetical protein
VKLLTTLLIAALAALMMYSARRRLWLALKTGAIVYLVVLFGRLAFSSFSLADRLEDLVWPVLGVLLAWVVLWFVSTTYERRKAARQDRSTLP